MMSKVTIKLAFCMLACFIIYMTRNYADGVLTGTWSIVGANVVTGNWTYTIAPGDPYVHYIDTPWLAAMSNQTGRFRVFCANDTLHLESRIVDGEPDGLWLIYFQRGNINRVGEMRKGKRQGVWTIWGEDGNIKEVEYYDMDGIVTQYFIKGVLIRQHRINESLREYEYNIDFNPKGYITNNNISSGPSEGGIGAVSGLSTNAR